jgi:hypothetical protein
VEIGGIFNHMPIVLEVSKLGGMSPSTMKFNKDCLKEEDYKNLVMDNWCPLDEESRISHMLHFVKTLKNKKVTST